MPGEEPRNNEERGNPMNIPPPAQKGPNSPGFGVGRHPGIVELKNPKEGRKWGETRPAIQREKKGVPRVVKIPPLATHYLRPGGGLAPGNRRPSKPQNPRGKGVFPFFPGGKEPVGAEEKVFGKGGVGEGKKIKGKNLKTQGQNQGNNGEREKIFPSVFLYPAIWGNLAPRYPFSLLTIFPLVSRAPSPLTPSPRGRPREMFPVWRPK